MAPLACAMALAVAGCGTENPLMTPVGWWHDLQGGAIASERPPPPGADLPYPKISTIPPKPDLPSNAYRLTVETQLAQERDDTERLAAHSPIIVQPAPPVPPKPPAPSAVAASTEAASATVPAADAPPPKAAPGPAHAAPAAASDGGPTAGTPLTIAGLPADQTGLPDIPAAPPPPATFEGMPAEPLPSKPPPLPPRAPPLGAAVYFRPGDAVLDSSQGETIRNAANRRGNGAIEVEGHGDAQSDTPAAQEAALRLGLERAQAIAKALEAARVPATKIRISATAFERGASVRDVP
jgi:outer membrane protein OmpA-like peptidoglycan-associated protein